MGPPWANNTPIHPSVAALAQTFDAAVKAAPYRRAPDGSTDSALDGLYTAALSQEELINSTFTEKTPVHKVHSLNAVVDQLIRAMYAKKSSFKVPSRQVPRCLRDAIASSRTLPIHNRKLVLSVSGVAP